METKICSIPGCDRPPRGRGLCGAHYERLRRAGQIPARVDRAEGCAVDGCEVALVVGNGYCDKHYRRWKTHGSPDDRAQTVEDRFWSYVDKLAGNACWPWTAGLWHNGYGYLRVGRDSKVAAHRLSYEIHVGLIPEGLQIDHLCRNRRCVNPAHLEAVTPKENVYRSEGMAARHARKTHCLRGHPFEPPNGYTTSQGHRGCRACDEIRYRAREARKKASRLKQAE